MFKLMRGNETSPRVQIFMKLVLALPLSKTVQSCATIDRDQKHAAVLKASNLMHPWGATVRKGSDVWLTITGPPTDALKVQRKLLTFRKSMIVLFWNPFRGIIIFVLILREIIRNQASKLWAGTDATGNWKLCMADWLKTWETQAAGSLSSHLWVCVCVCVCVCVWFSAAPNEISRQAESFSSSLQQRLKVRLADSADAFYSPQPAPSCRMRGYRCPPTPLLISTPIHPLHTLPSLHYHPGPPWQGSVHLPVKLGGGRRGWRPPPECLDTLADVLRGDG